MATSKGVLAYICEQAGGAGQVTSRPMFGEFGLYCDGKFIGVVCDNQLFLKVTPAGREFAPDLVLASAYPGAKPSFLIPQERIANADWLARFVRLTHDALPVTKARKRT